MTPQPWELRAGDNLDLLSGLPSLPDKSCDVTITDPPFEEQAHSQGRRIVTGTARLAKERPMEREIRVAPIAYPPITEAERRGIARHVARVTRRWILTFCQSEAVHLWRSAYEAAGARYVRTGVYHKTDAQPQYSGDRPGVGWEAIVICHGTLERRTRRTGRTRWNGGGRCARWSAAADARFGQRLLVDGQKPLELALQLVDDFTDPGELILDPFAGAASFGLAAIMRGRRYLAWERKPEHYEIARRRLAGEQARPDDSGQRSLFGAP